MRISPYKFLDSYTKEDREIFFGRDREIEELYSKVFESKILIVYGTSGTGKSSLINCGLANKFDDSDWLPVTIRRGTDINRNLADSLSRLMLTDPFTGKRTPSGNRTDDILKIIKSIYLDHFKPLYLIFDQFEELFIFGDSREKNELLTSISKVNDSDLPCRFIFSIREEYLAGLTEFEKVIPSFFSNRIRIEKMTRENATQVIEGPCRLNGITVDPGFSQRLLEKLNPDSPEIELTWLQVILDKVFRLASGNGQDVTRITVDLIDKAGEVKDLLASFLDEQVSQLDDPEEGLVVLKSFVSAKGTKHQIGEGEVIEYSKTIGKDITGETIKGLIQKFVRLRILRDKDEHGRYELRHDSLAGKIYEKITLFEKELLEIKLFLENAYLNHEKRHRFLTGDDLKYIAPYEDRLFLSEKVTRFISQSKRALLKVRKRRQNILIAGAVTGFVVLSAFTIWALSERRNALNQKHVADTQRDRAEQEKIRADSARVAADAARADADQSRDQAILQSQIAVTMRRRAEENAAEAAKQQEIAEKNEVTARQQERISIEARANAENEKLKAVDAGNEARRLSLISTAQNLALKFSGTEKDPELMGLLAVQAFVFNRDNNGMKEDPIIYEALSKAYLSLDSSNHSVYKGSPNEIRILREEPDGSLITADLDGQIRSWTDEVRGRLVYTLTSQSPINFIGSSPTGELMITQHDNGELFLRDLKVPGKMQELKGHNSFVHAMAFSESGKYLATAGMDSTVIVWDPGIQPVLKINTMNTGSNARAVIFCNDDSLLIAQEDGNIILWDINQNRSSSLFMSESDKPLCLAWNDSKKILVAGCRNGNLLLFKLAGGKFGLDEIKTVHSSGIDLIAFNPDGSLLATSSWDNTIRFYNYLDFFELGNTIGGAQQIRNLNNRTRSLIFTRDNRLVAGLSDRSIRMFETSSEKLAALICSMINRDMTAEEWNEMVGGEIPYEGTCSGKH